jgi:hypothetical protein
MALDKKHPQYEELQDILNDLRDRIDIKREEAIKLFSELLQQLEKGKKLPEALKAQIEEIKVALKIGSKEESTQEKKEDKVAELTTEDILKAIQSLATAGNKKIQINAQLLREELRIVIAMRLSEQQNKLPEQLRNVATAGDYINMLNSKNFKGIADGMGGAEKLLGESIKLATATCQIANNLSGLKASLGNVGLPNNLSGDKSTNR